ncbi:glycosyltransferase family 25 protein, partial [uncultured Nitratireductor sp.]|uniref:glycosyltransferase family 25 protein n=1 Tax=uncultured Nitratireductor sp. TaxID=520953 RepID=UPI0025E22D14
MLILVINLDREEKRLLHMRDEFSAHGLEFQRVAAVDARNLSDEVIASRRKGAPNFYELGAGEVACFLSHRRCWEIAADSAETHTLVCEDDLFLGKDAGSVLADRAWMPEDDGIVKVEASRFRIMLGKRAVSEVQGRSVHALYRDYAGAGAYVLSRTCARELLDMTESFCDPVDQFLFNRTIPGWHGRPVYQLVPAVAIQEVFLKPRSGQALGSALQGERRTKRRTGLGKLRREVTRPFEQVAGVV